MPQPVLTLSPVLHQRRANRHVTEYRPERGSAGAWTGAQDEGRELRAYDRIRDEPTRGRKPGRRPGAEVNGNVVRPEGGAGAGKRGSGGGRGRRVAPGQELPSVRTWFAGESRDGTARPGAPRGGPGATNNSNRRNAGGKPSGTRSGSPYGGESRGANGNRAPAGRPGQAARPQGQGGNRSPGNSRPQGQGQGQGRPAGGRPPGRGGNRSGNR